MKASNRAMRKKNRRKRKEFYDQKWYLCVVKLKQNLYEFTFFLRFAVFGIKNNWAWYFFFL